MLNVICLAFVFSIPAHAYIDPAATSYIIQIVAGIVIALGAVIGIFWSKIKRLFKKKDKQESEDVEYTAQDDNDDNDEVVTADELLDSMNKDEDK